MTIAAEDRIEYIEKKGKMTPLKFKRLNAIFANHYIPFNIVLDIDQELLDEMVEFLANDQFDDVEELIVEEF